MKVAAVVEGETPSIDDVVHLNFKQDQTRLYIDGWLATAAREIKL